MSIADLPLLNAVLNGTSAVLLLTGFYLISWLGTRSIVWMVGLVLLAMALLFGYFYSVRTAMQSYLKVLRQELPQSSEAPSAPGAPADEPTESPAGTEDGDPEAERRG